MKLQVFSTSHKWEVVKLGIMLIAKIVVWGAKSKAGVSVPATSAFEHDYASY